MKDTRLSSFFFWIVSFDYSVAATVKVFVLVFSKLNSSEKYWEWKVMSKSTRTSVQSSVDWLLRDGINRSLSYCNKLPLNRVVMKRFLFLRHEMECILSHPSNWSYKKLPGPKGNSSSCLCFFPVSPWQWQFVFTWFTWKATWPASVSPKLCGPTDQQDVKNGAHYPQVGCTTLAADSVQNRLQGPHTYLPLCSRHGNSLSDGIGITSNGNAEWTSFGKGHTQTRRPSCKKSLMGRAFFF